MKITPLEIRQKTFEKAFRGLDKDEVNAFLLTLSQQWEKLQDENKDLRMKLDAAHRETQKLREVESSLYKTLKTAEDTGNSILEQAKKSAELQARESGLKADEIMSRARNEARQMLEEAQRQSERVIAEMQQHVKSLDQECRQMENYMDHLVRDLRNLASETLENADKAKAKPKAGTHSILSKAANTEVSSSELLKNLKDMDKTSNNNTYQLPESTAENAPVALTASNAIGDPAPDVTQPQPEVPSTPDPMVPNVPSPEIEQPEPDYPGRVPAPDIEQPVPEIQPVQPDQPEIQPPLTEPSRNSFVTNGATVKPKTGGSFFDEIG
ncbi:DivIVA domain-containing protein [Pontibacter mangrovi]|uniref:DivIVA domain-containing protein n=1 Tax=Pontibacter mangrovi TaxID=2589816 RepID=A0A501W5W4_9BACT|nr:DivIVA domain-containing protein [Pontibacter mangrovi]TPE44668.1 DivIVA domain-containing protein [Pontibacter mangrovi]